MLENLFSDVYSKFKVNFYTRVLSRFESRETSLTTVEVFCLEIIHLLGKPTINEFASFTQISSPNAAYKITNLVKKGYKDALLEREKMYPTGIKAIKGIAIPHADQEYTKKETVIVVTLDKPCLFKAMGGGCGQEVKVEVLFLLILSEKKQVNALSKIVSFIQDENKMNSFDKDNSIEIIYDYFGKYL